LKDFVELFNSSNKMLNIVVIFIKILKLISYEPTEPNFSHSLYKIELYLLLNFPGLFMLKASSIF